MKTKTYLTAFISTVLLSSSVLAKPINMYDQPMTISKVVGTIDSSSGVIPIFTPKGGDWVKVGDPRNGNVGWIKSSDLSSGNTTSFSFTQKVMNDGKAPQTYKIEFGNIPTMDAKQSEEMLKKFQEQQNAIQKSAQKAVQEMMNNINKLYQQQPQLLYDNGKSAIVMPIVIVPASTLKQPAGESNKK